MSTIVKVNPLEVVDFIKMCAAHNKAAMIWGLAGVGKSSIINNQVAKELDVKPQNVIDLRLTTKDNIDLRGLTFPNHENRRTETYHPSFFPDSDSEERYIIFMDEVNLAEPSTQKASYQLVLDRRIDEYVLPKNTIIILAGNTDEAGGMTFPMPRPLTNRMAHAELVMEFEFWKPWAEANRIHPLILAFLTNYTDLLNSNMAGVAFPSSRTWVDASDLLWDMKFFNIMTKVYHIDPQLYLDYNYPQSYGQHIITEFDIPRFDTGNGSVEYDKRMLEIMMKSCIGTAVGDQFIALVDSLLDILPKLDDIFDDKKTEDHSFDLNDSAKVHAFGYIMGNRIKSHLSHNTNPQIVTKKFLHILRNSNFSSGEYQIAFWMAVNSIQSLAGIIMGNEHIKNTGDGVWFRELIQKTAKEITIS